VQAEVYARGGAIEVVGAIIYTGNQPELQATSCVFSGSSTVRKLIDQNKLDVQKFLDYCTTSIKCVVTFFIVMFANL
jgi:hypothetical protein